MIRLFLWITNLTDENNMKQFNDENCHLLEVAPWQLVNREIMLLALWSYCEMLVGSGGKWGLLDDFLLSEHLWLEGAMIFREDINNNYFKPLHCLLPPPNCFFAKD